MLERPVSCRGCPLDTLATGFMQVREPVDPYHVTLIGEALGEDEANAGEPFVGKAGFRLSRLIEYAGLNRKSFQILNTVFCRPPDNKLEGEAYEAAAIAHCRAQHWGSLVESSKVLVPMGNVPTRALLGRSGILSMRGYIDGKNGHYILPTVHPSYINRGNAKWSAPFINDIQKAVRIAREGYPPQIIDYRLDPNPLAAYRWAQGYRERLLVDPGLYLSFDIETPGKGEDEEDLDTDSDLPDRTWNIDRIGFSYEPHGALSIAWAPEYFAAIRLLLASDGPKVVWNAGFDVPRVRRAGVEIHGIIHDGMVAWHILHSDLPKKLGFVATFTCPFQPAWKHLSHKSPAYYNATDADVELRSMIHIEEQLRSSGLWEVYQRDVLDLDPILVHMHTKGMPVDDEIRLDRAIKLAEQFKTVRGSLEETVPLAARRIAHVYKNPPTGDNLIGLLTRPGTRTNRRCNHCGHERPRKDHFRRLVKKINPCADAGVRESQEVCLEWYRLAAFSPSRDQLIRYHQYIRRPLPMVFDKKTRTRKVSFGERQIKDLIGKFPQDVVYSLILQYRELDKLAGTYVGRPSLE